MGAPKPPEPDPVPTDNTGNGTSNTDNSTNTNNTSSSSPSSSSTSSGPPDPLEGLNSIQRQKYAMLASAYAGIWGEPPDPDVVKRALKEGLNVWQFSLQQRMDPAFLTTKTFKDGADTWVTLLKNLGAAG